MGFCLVRLWEHHVGSGFESAEMECNKSCTG